MKTFKFCRPLLTNIMSVQETKGSIEDDAYQVVEATNEDGTIDAEIIGKPYREGDELVIEARPLIPDADTEVFQLNWPKRNTTQFKAVRLARSKVGGFQAIGQMENERVKLEETDGDWDLVIPEQEAGNLESVKPYLSSGAVSIFKSLIVVLFFASVAGVIAPFVLALLYPFGVTVLSIWQGISVLVGSLVLLFVTGIAIDKIIADE